MASTYLSRTFETATNRRKCTISYWVKKCGFPNATQQIFCSYYNNNYRFQSYFMDDDTLALLNIDNNNTNVYLTTNAKYRDPNAWYHVVQQIDTTQSTSSDRVKVYVNGEQITSFANSTYPSQNDDMSYGASTYTHYIGRYGTDSNYLDGVLSHYYFIDGAVIAHTEFGETDSTTGEWKIKTSPTISSFGNSGCKMFINDNSVNDQSGNSNNFTLGGGTLTKTEDCPSNVFCTMNPLNAVYISFLQGNNTISGGNNGSDYSYIGSTLAANSGKFYWEVKAADLAEIDQVGVALASSSFTGIGLGGGLQNNFGGKSVQFSNGNKAGDSAQSAHMGGFSEDDIMMVALDLDNNKITFGRNGQWSDGSGNANQTYANSTAAFTNLTAGEYYMPAHAMRGYGGNTGISRYNFGNGYFATTAVSSAGTNASNIGIFEYDVPSGFTALSTKGLNL